MRKMLLRLEINHEYGRYEKDNEFAVAKENVKMTKIIIDRDTGKLNLIFKEDDCVIHKKEYTNKALICVLLDEIFPIKEKFLADNDCRVKNKNIAKNEIEMYFIKVIYFDIDTGETESKTYQGIYSRFDLPKNWWEILCLIKEFIDNEDYNASKKFFVYPHVYYSELMEDECFWYGVFFHKEHVKLYYKYDKFIPIGKQVIVEFDNKDTRGRVVSFHTEPPYLPTGKIIKKICD